ncbi:MAG TPA: FkbM family methyltransferase [Myxococcales bacterium]|jgi:FkbM family methyltransferase
MNNPLASALSRASLWSERHGLVPAAVRWPLRAARRAVVRTGDPLVRYRHAGFDLWLPLSHQLPYYRLWFPEYDLALGRLARAVAARHPEGSVVDIGANVGDSAAVIRSGCDLPLLCIEGDPRFFALLQRNAPALGADVRLVQALVGDGAESAQVSLSSSFGTARLVKGGEVRLESLQTILEREKLPTPGLVKIDTDGYDCRIVTANLTLLRRHKPVLFFEYDPAFYPHDFDALGFFRGLAAAEYDRLLVYENTGDFLLSLRLSDEAALRDLHEHYRGRKSLRYADLCLFSGADADLAASFHESELAHYRVARPS